MAVDDARLRAAVDAITDVEGLSMDPDSLVEDVYLLAYAFPEDDDFEEEDGFDPLPRPYGAYRRAR